MWEAVQAEGSVRKAQEHTVWEAVQAEGSVQTAYRIAPAVSQVLMLLSGQGASTVSSLSHHFDNTHVPYSDLSISSILPVVYLIQVRPRVQLQM